MLFEPTPRWTGTRRNRCGRSLRRHIRRLLTKYHYPPDKQEAAVQLVMQQAELLAAGVAS